MKTVAIVNPTAGHGRASRRWPQLLKSLGEKAAPVITWWTEGPHQAESLAAQARREGFGRVIAVGGDGTIFEVVNGLWWETEGELPSLGLVPFGTGCDYVRNFTLGRTLGEKLATALVEPTVSVDVGICHLVGLDGEPRARIFFNVLGFGFDAAVIDRFRRRRLKLRGKLPYFIAGLQEMVQTKYYRVKGQADDEPIDTAALIFVVGLGRSFGGGMRVTPEGRPWAGRFQAVWGGRLTRFELLRLLPKIYAGQHLNHPKVHSRYARVLELRAEPPAYVEAEGELIGRTPIKLELYPRALRVAARNFRRTPPGPVHVVRGSRS
jgi:diacylglycerol kinase (ATP)